MKAYFDDIINELTLQELQETICSNSYHILHEVWWWPPDWFKNEEGVVDIGKKLFGAIWNNVSGWFKGLNLPEKFTQLKEYLSNSNNLTTAGLAGAGLLGAYYLYKKFLSKKKLDSNDARYAARIQQLQPNQLPPNIANQQIG